MPPKTNPNPKIPMPAEPQDLISLLEENGGRLGNLKARSLLEKKLNIAITKEEYERLRDQLISIAKVKKGKGKGGSIELLDSDSSDLGQPGQVDGDSGMQHIETLYTSLGFIPGLRAKLNQSTITLTIGDDNDKLFCGWDDQRVSYFVQYRLEPGRIDASEAACSVFNKSSSDIEGAKLEKLGSKTTLYSGKSVVQINKVVRRLASLLEDITLGFGSEESEEKDTLKKIRPREEEYYLEIASLIKICVATGLKWPLKNWRKTLGFDDVDSLIVIGSSKEGRKEKYREHVVPVSLIKDEAIRLAEKGAPEIAIAEFIEHHLYIVHITNEEAKRLNSTDATGFSLKTSMPEGWVFGCDPLQRLKDAGIAVSYDHPIPIPKWKPWKKQTIKQKIKDLLNTPVIKV